VDRMNYTTLMDTGTLAQLLGDGDVVVVDCRFDLADTAAGERLYAQGHIPGAIYAHLDRDLAGPKTGTNGRHPLPSADAVLSTFGRFGIDSDVQVVAYDQDSGMWASRLWWMLHWMGHARAAVLDGGFAKWTAEQRPVRAGVETNPPRRFDGTPREELTVTATEVGALAESSDVRIVDARAPERYRGEVEPIDRVAGHIPGAVNHFFQKNLLNGQFRSPPELRSQFSASLGEVSGDRVICYCGSGVTACHNVLALEHAGIPGARLYPGSWSEWVADSDREVEVG
jgi:thiosulfate/3-mercaptopyruvate sulfurtransferase